MSIEKRELLVVGKSKAPRCFKGIQRLLVHYCANTNAWITAVFTEWLQGCDKELK